ncbi:hypothetical protein SSP24_28250 [Streptomyces spinoverrucosus]|uniref:Uncharacterized protein n=1 Tax=Streptomyces spinoverrucosus TaxID=284043 RepID=A0A4Y3VH95_9ACTN|nr:hypothetical protein SSP24_28250 [Streptomyces spinoverrucosus]GHB72343.1 hypothetical protein GCM10010397_48420 [Streptomyces spinoverrucosus]
MRGRGAGAAVRYEEPTRRPFAGPARRLRDVPRRLPRSAVELSDDSTPSAAFEPPKDAFMQVRSVRKLLMIGVSAARRAVGVQP